MIGVAGYPTTTTAKPLAKASLLKALIKRTINTGSKQTIQAYAILAGWKINKGMTGDPSSP